MKLITTNGYEFEIDEQDYEYVKSRKWFAQGRPGYFYVATTFALGDCKYKIKYLHRLLLGVTSRNEYVDHVNHNTLDCRRANLRLSNAKLNQANSKISRGASTYKGVTFESKKWRARIRENGKKVHLGSFNSEIDAAAAYNVAAKRVFGEHSYQNEIYPKTPC